METTQLRLSDAVGVELGAQAQAQLTIEDNDAGGPAGASPVESPEGFVRQQYLDLLGREPEPEGERYRVGLMNDCRACGRADVSARFFRSREFEGRGYRIPRAVRKAEGGRRQRPDCPCRLPVLIASCFLPSRFFT